MSNNPCNRCRDTPRCEKICQNKILSGPGIAFKNVQKISLFPTSGYWRWASPPGNKCCSLGALRKSL